MNGIPHTTVSSRQKATQVTFELAAEVRDVMMKASTAAARAVIATLIFVPSLADAQSAYPTIGARVRLTAPELQMRGSTGTVVDMTADTLFIVRWHQAPRTAIPVTKLSRLEVSGGKNRPRGMLRGGAFGLVLGGLVGVGIAGLTETEDGPDGIGSSEDVAIIAGTTGLITLMGVGVGAAMPPDRWQDATLHPPANRGMGDAGPMRIGLRIAF